MKDKITIIILKHDYYLLVGSNDQSFTLPDIYPVKYYRQTTIKYKHFENWFLLCGGLLGHERRDNGKTFLSKSSLFSAPHHNSQCSVVVATRINFSQRALDRWFWMLRPQRVSLTWTIDRSVGLKRLRAMSSFNRILSAAIYNIMTKKDILYPMIYMLISHKTHNSSVLF